MTLVLKSGQGTSGDPCTRSTRQVVGLIGGSEYGTATQTADRMGTNLPHAGRMISTTASDARSTPAYKSAIEFMFGRIDYERSLKMPYSRNDLNLRRMRRLLELLGDPHNRLKIIHVAGTKGKGSTSAFLSSALTTAGYRCGAYTSPHLHYLEERYRIDGHNCDPLGLASVLEADSSSRRADGPGMGTDRANVL